MDDVTNKAQTKSPHKDHLQSVDESPHDNQGEPQKSSKPTLELAAGSGNDENEVNLLQFDLLNLDNEESVTSSIPQSILDVTMNDVSKLKLTPLQQGAILNVSPSTSSPSLDVVVSYTSALKLTPL